MQATITLEFDIFVEATGDEPPEFTEIGLVLYDPKAAPSFRHKTSRMVPISLELAKLLAEHVEDEANYALAEADAEAAESAAEQRWEMESGR
jgi:hypothetical protein